jgi:hypothetical protein
MAGSIFSGPHGGEVTLHMLEPIAVRQHFRFYNIEMGPGDVGPVTQGTELVGIDCSWGCLRFGSW